VHNIYSNLAFDYNIVPDTVWFDTSSNAGASNSIVLDSLAVTVAAPTVLPGDFNGDGLVDAADYVVWRRGGAAYTPSDYITWRTHFGQTVFDVATGANLVAATVPEVSSVLLLCVGGLNLVLARRNPCYSWHR
jgi:hypothetical protein